MRLTALRLVGFKSFVEPTDIRFPSELVGIVGPNGCGKSNTLDAVRWVMGESSAKHLRGQSLDDVIFAGSGQRKAVAQASVELVFDNASGVLKGPWARPGEISVRRVLTRDGQSKYFLNGARCRRKDIADLFLGTGLGSRSYAIIEQGQINRLIEARPEEMRATLEEAAGISRYKEKRRETEGSIQHTRENLARIDDLREELGRQLERLERQARTAERFRQLQRDEQSLHLALHALMLRRLAAEQAVEAARLAAEEAVLAEALATQRQASETLETVRAGEAASQDAVHRAQAEAYAQGAEVARLEQALRHAHELAARVDQDGQALAGEMAAHARLADEAREQLARLHLEHALAEEAVAPLEADAEQARSALARAEQATLQARSAFEQAQARAQEPIQQLKIEQTRQEHIERQIQALHERRRHLRPDQLEDEIRRHEAESADAQAARQACQRVVEEHERGVEAYEATIQAARARLVRAESEADVLRRDEAGVAAELRALRALAQAAAAERPAALRDWLRRNDLEGARAGDRVYPEPRWAEALDAVLGDALEAIPVGSLDDWREVGRETDTLGLWLVEEAPEDARRESLLGALAPALLGGLRTVASLDEAFARRHELGRGECWLTPEGDRVGRHAWRRPLARAGHDGALVRRLRLESIEASMEALRPRLAETEAQVGQAREALRGLEAGHGEAQRALREALRRQGESATRAEQARLRLEQAQGRLRGQRRELDETAADLERLERQREAHRQAQESLGDACRAGEDGLTQARASRDAAEQVVRQARDGLREAEQRVQSARARLDGLARELGVRAQAVAQQTAQAERLAERRLELERRRHEVEAPLPELTEALDRARVSESIAAGRLGEARAALDEAREAARRAQEALMRAERELDVARQATEGRRLTVQALILRSEGPGAVVAEAGEAAVERALTLFAGLDVEAVGARLEETRARIARLGAVNLAALEEFEEARRRKDYLDAQQADLGEALATLEAAIAKMDRETRGRFRETFEAVNAKLGEMFRQLFGGGEAYLSLTSDDWLEAGVALMARPPGKKVSHIHLLSGGEKSLTAIALVFAIFQLNPAPFCLLDEVDAPLDEANVGRFCAMVRAMSERVQFIFITHNKTTMELARQLVGVTMREAGVSRIVAVDLDAAVRLLDS
ncbi:MAG: chromosome segregation protein SMC [Pseudomonadota bacterium]